MIRITKPGDPRILHTYFKFACKDCGCEFIADESDYTVETLNIYSEYDPISFGGYRQVDKYSVTCPCCGTYILTETATSIPYKEVVKFDEKEKKAHVWG